MKLHSNKMGTNPRRVGVYLAEKGLQIELIEVDTTAREHKRPEFLAMNPAGTIPVLELDDGGALPESAAIVEYLEELNPEPPMIGVTPAERAKVRALERIASELVERTSLMLQHSHAYFADRVKQNPAVAEVMRAAVEQHLTTLEQHIGENAFLTGNRPTIADCTLFALFQSCRQRLKIDFATDRPRLSAWYDRFAQRPSAAYP